MTYTEPGRTTPRQIPRTIVAGAFAMLALIAAGCSSAPAGADSSNSPSAAHEQAMRFAQCMRDNGVSAFPDPNASGSFTIDQIANGSSVDTSSAAFQQALSACKDQEPAGFAGTKRTPQQQENALKFAQCIRENGVPDFPDPTADGPLVDTNRIPSANQPGGMDLLRAAMQKCGSYARAAGVSGSQ